MIELLCYTIIYVLLMAEVENSTSVILTVKLITINPYLFCKNFAKLCYA